MENFYTGSSLRRPLARPGGPTKPSGSSAQKRDPDFRAAAALPRQGEDYARYHYIMRGQKCQYFSQEIQEKSQQIINSFPTIFPCDGKCKNTPNFVMIFRKYGKNVNKITIYLHIFYIFPITFPSQTEKPPQIRSGFPKILCKLYSIERLNGNPAAYRFCASIHSMRAGSV